LRFGKAAFIVVGAAILLEAEMQPWVQHLPSGDWLKVFLRGVPLPDGAIETRRPPAETRPALTQLINANPKEAALYKLRAQEAELQLDFVAAESDWGRYVQLSSNSGAAWLELADYFHRRHQAPSEVDALRVAGRSTPQAFERALQVIDEQALPDSSAIAIYRAWMQRYPQEPGPRQHFIGFLTSRELSAAANEQLAAYKKAFPVDSVYPVKAAADLAPDSLAVYEREFQPLWPDELTVSYLKLLESSSGLRSMVAASRARLEQDPDNIREAGRLFLYWRQQNNIAAARRVLDEYRLSKRSRKAAWKPEELYTAARLYEKLPDAVEAAELYYTLYSLPGADAHYVEQSLSALAAVLLANAEQPIRFGAGDLSFYKDIATLDGSPGFFNGILSLILNGTGPRWEYGRQNVVSTAYFHRAAASELVELLDRRFPQSASRAELHAQLIQACNMYGDDETVIRTGRAFLATFPQAGQRVDIAMTVADGLARGKRTREEFALYDQMLGELGRRASGMPTASAPAYARVLDRYLARLAAMHQPMEGVRLYRHEIDRNPNDPGLYERYAAFLNQANMGAETESIYREAMAKFQDRSWYAKLARWYLAKEQQAAAAKLTQELTAIFSGTELERYFGEIVTSKNLGAVLCRQLNLYAHERFPEDLVFVHNLLYAYSSPGTRDEAARVNLLRQYWYYEPGLRNQFFEGLSSTGKLAGEIAAIRDPQVLNANPAAAQFLAEAEAWRSHFEDSAPQLRTVAESFPGDSSLTSRATSLYRSLATLDDKHTATAVALARLEARAKPRDREALAQVGDIYADRERFTAARPSWDAMPATAPGSVDAWRDAATVFWDYYLYDDALRVIRTARARKSDATLLAFEAGAIYEGKRQEDRAVAEYLSGYLDGDNQSLYRILKLARRPGVRDAVDRLTAEAANRSDAEWPAVFLRVSVLQQQQRNAEATPLLLGKIASTRSLDLLKKIEDAAGELPEVREKAMERQIAVTQDPVEQVRLRIALMRFFESRKDVSAAARTIDALYKERPNILGVVRATVEFYTRHEQPQDAIRVLTASASRANDEYRDQFTVEAARLATKSRGFEQARTLLQPLLERNPYNSEYLAAMADTYLQAGDDARFRDFEIASIKSLRTSPLVPADRIARIAAMRRDLIPALTRLSDYAGAADQYIEVINSYPEDDGLIREASLYAARHSLGKRITDFYGKTIAEAPRDYRWPMVLARVDTALEDFPAAIASYDGALKARPDRKDLLAERETIEERSLLLDRAVASCQTLYDLSYRDPQWMRKSAELKARLGHREDAIRDLRTAIIGSAKETPETMMMVAQQLDVWNYAAEAASYAERVDPAAEHIDAGSWARILMRGRKSEKVLPQLLKIAATVSPAGQTVTAYYTPEEKTALDATIRKTADRRMLPFAESAEFTQLQSDLLNRELETASPESGTDRALINLETRRTRFSDLAKSMEALARRRVDNPQIAYQALAQAENAWRSEGDRAGELRVLGELESHRALGGELQNRYFALLNPGQRERVVALARSESPAVAFAMRSGDFTFARQAVQARGTAFPPVWTSAYTALAGVYDDVHTPEVAGAFRASLGGGTIGERVRHRADTKQQAVGHVWFYYGARYGEYLDRANDSAAKVYLPSEIEATPGNPEAYFAFGSAYEERGRLPQAIEQYQNTLQLDADRGDAENAIARVLWRDNRRDEAVGHWRAAIAAFDRIENRGVRVPESFWSGFTTTVEEIGKAKQIPALRPDIEKLLRGYANINGSYRTFELLNAAMRACLESGVDYGWVLNIGAENEWLSDELLSSIDREFHLTADQQEEIARRRIDLALQRQKFVLDFRMRLIDLLIEHGKIAAAQQAWDALSADDRSAGVSRITEFRLAAFTGKTTALLQRYQADPQNGLDYQQLLSEANFLRSHGHGAEANVILEFAYQRELEWQHLDSANFLGLARVYLDAGQTDRAVQLLRRMNRVSGIEFDTFVPAATLLAEYGKTAEAIPFLRDRVKSTPWDDAARLELGGLLNGDERQSVLSQVVQNADALYWVRASAARLIKNSAVDASTELGLLQHERIGPAEARKPFYVEARRTAGLYREALEIQPSSTMIRLETLRAALDARQNSVAIAVAPGLPLQPFLAGVGLKERERADFARDLSMAYEREGNLANALNYTQTAIQLGLGLESRRAEIQAAQRRQAENARRAPAIRDNIEQDHKVEPHL
jgi:thioredoxin-like negative regulator of GroEL